MTSRGSQVRSLSRPPSVSHDLAGPFRGPPIDHIGSLSPFRQGGRRLKTEAISVSRDHGLGGCNLGLAYGAGRLHLDEDGRIKAERIFRPSRPSASQILTNRAIELKPVPQRPKVMAKEKAPASSSRGSLSGMNRIIRDRATPSVPGWQLGQRGWRLRLA